VSIVTLHEGDNRATLRRLIDQGVRVHSVVTDPPYGLTSVVKRFGKEGAAPAKHGTDGAFSRASAGFMGKAWDGTGIERDPEFWRLIWEILLPGGFVFAFSGSRTGHWQACAMEMAGFIMHPMHGWVYGSGMPKAHNPCPAIDKHMGMEGSRNLIGETVRRMRPGADQNNDGTWEKLGDREYERGTYAPASPEAQQWDGWRHGTQSQKPALEPIYLGQKPYSEKTGALNILKHGVGAVNIDGCRVATEPGDYSQGGDNKTVVFHTTESDNNPRTEQHPLGRWPANLIHDGSAEVVALFPANAKGGGAVTGDEPSASHKHAYNERDRVPSPAYGDDGSAARFFNSFDEGPDADAIIYHAKATKADRAGSKHPTVKPIGLMEHLIKHITPPGGLVLDPFAGSGTTAEAARREGFDCVLMEAEPEYAAFLRQRFDLPGDDFDDMLGGAELDDALLG